MYSAARCRGKATQRLAWAGTRPLLGGWVGLVGGWVGGWWVGGWVGGWVGAGLVCGNAVCRPCLPASCQQTDPLLKRAEPNPRGLQITTSERSIVVRAAASPPQRTHASVMPTTSRTQAQSGQKTRTRSSIGGRRHELTIAAGIGSREPLPGQDSFTTPGRHQ